MKDIIISYDEVSGNLYDDKGTYIGLAAPGSFVLERTPETELAASPNENVAVQLVGMGTSTEDIVKLKACGLI